MSKLFNITLEKVSGESRYLDVEQVQADSYEVCDGTLYLYSEKGILYYNKYYWRKCERIE